MLTGLEGERTVESGKRWCASLCLRVRGWGSSGPRPASGVTYGWSRPGRQGETQSARDSLCRATTDLLDLPSLEFPLDHRHIEVANRFAVVPKDAAGGEG